MILAVIEIKILEMCIIEIKIASGKVLGKNELWQGLPKGLNILG